MNYINLLLSVVLLLSLTSIFSLPQLNAKDLNNNKKELSKVKNTEKTDIIKDKKSIKPKKTITIKLINDPDIEKSIVILDKMTFGPEVIYGVSQVKKGDSTFLKEIDYTLLKNIVLMFNESARKNKTLLTDEFAISPFLKRKVIKSFIGGLYNKDPRVRLTSVIAIKGLLRSLKDIKIPKKTKKGLILSNSIISKLKKKYKGLYIKTINEVAIETKKVWSIETVNKRKYLGIAINGRIVLANVYRKVNDLDLFIVRELSLEKLNTGALKPKDFTHTKLRVIRSLTKKIGNESDYSVPINSDLLLKDRLAILINSLENRNQKVKRIAAIHLLFMYYSKFTDNQVKNKIESTRKNNIFLDNTFKKYISEKQKEYIEKTAE